jgi:alpha-galactosidase
LIERYNIPLDEYPRRCEDQISKWQALRDDLESGFQIPVKRSSEYTSLIIHGLETGIPQQVNANLPNQGLISNLPEGCCVEVPCQVDAQGIHPLSVGALPPHLAALIQTNVNVQALTVQAALTGERETIYHAAMLDPHTAAELDLEQIWALVDELIEAHREWLPSFASSGVNPAIPTS